MAYGPSTGLSAGGVGRGTGAAAVRPPLRAAPLVRPKVVPLTDEQVAAQQVKAAFDPILNNLTSQYNARGAAQAQAITGSTDELARLMGSYGPTAASAYDRAASNDAAINSVLASTRQGQGADASAALAGKLGGIDTGTAARVNGNLGSDLAGESLASATKGANNLAMLLGQGASAADYGAKLPGIAGGIGLNAQKQTQGQITNELSTQLAALAAQEPKAVQDAIGAIQTNRARNAQLDFERSLATNKGNTPKIVHTSDGSVIAVNPTTGETVATISGPRAPKPTKPTTFKGTDGRTYVYNPGSGTAKPITGQSGPKTSKGGLTPNELDKLKGKAYATADDSYHGYSITSGSGANAVTTQKQGVPYGVAMKRMLRQGIPAAIAQAELNQFYKPGERGRPETAAQKKNDAAVVTTANTLFPVYGS